MTLEEAIKRMSEDVTHLREKGNDHLADSEQLGIEALRRIKEQRDFGLLGKWTALSSETKK